MNMFRQNWQSLIKPHQVELRSGEQKGRRTTLVFEPLEEGFGITLGNALRRVLLSSLRGAAVTSVRFHNALHEFTSLPGVKEDVTHILLNLKSLDIKLNTPGPVTLRIKSEGARRVTAGLIDTGAGIQLLSPDQLICTLGDDAKVDFEVIVEEGKGYSSAVERSQENLPLGTILLDAIFNPVRACMFRVESTRVGQFTNYDKLFLTVETNGSLSPEDAVGAAARILQTQLSKMITFSDEEDVETEEVMGDKITVDPNLLKRVEELDLSLRASNCLKRENIVYIGDLVTKSEVELLGAPNFGRKSLSEISDILSHMGLCLGMSVPGWPPPNMDEMLKKYKSTTMKESFNNTLTKEAQGA